MTKFLSIVLSVTILAACGKGETNEELCEQQCDLTQDWVDGCADEHAEGDWEVEGTGESCVAECKVHYSSLDLIGGLCPLSSR